MANSWLKCWELNKKCPMVHLPEGKRGCPAYLQDGKCWEVNWVEFIDNLEDKNQKRFWRQYILEGCRNCPVYSYHEEEIESRVEELSGQ